MIPSSGQYATDTNLRARQRLWQFVEPPFDLLGWVLDLTRAGPGSDVLDVGCGNGAYLSRLRRAFESVELVRPTVATTVVVTDADVVADYVASVADLYQEQLADDWSSVVEGTRQAAQTVIARHGRITTRGDSGAFVCR